LRILSFLVRARRILQVDELREVVPVRLDKYKLYYKRDLPAATKLTDVCARLVVIDEISNIIRQSSLYCLRISSDSLPDRPV
jgi:hypothetical protein